MGVAEEVEREKQTLPFGWGRFGKALEELPQILEPGESLLASCVALSPEYQYKPKFVPGSVLSTGHALHELTKTTNVVLACTSARMIMIATGAGGSPRGHSSLAYEGLHVVSRAKKEFVLASPEGEMRIRGAAKQQLPGFLAALETRAAEAGAGLG